MVLKNFLKYFLFNQKNIDDHRPLTEYLKRSNNFKKAAYKIHDTKEGLKNKIMNSFDNMLNSEDEIKLIEDKKYDPQRKNQKK